MRVHGGRAAVSAPDRCCDVNSTRQPFSIREQADGGGEIGFCRHLRGTEQDHVVGALIEPGVTGSDGHDLCFGDHGKELEVEVTRGSLRGVSGPRQDAVPGVEFGALGDLKFSECTEQSVPRASLAWSACSVNCGHRTLMVGRLQLGQQAGEACGIDAGGVHARSPPRGY